VIGDTNLESTENFVVNLTPVSGATGTPQGIGSILNDDGPPTITISDATVTAERRHDERGVHSSPCPRQCPETVHVPLPLRTNTAVSVPPTPDFVGASRPIDVCPGRPVVRQFSLRRGPRPARPPRTRIVLPQFVRMSAAAGHPGRCPSDRHDCPTRITVNDVTVVEGNPGSNNHAVSRSRSRRRRNHPGHGQFRPTADGNSPNP